MAVRDVLLIGVLVFVLALGFFVIKFTADTVIAKMVSIPQINQSADTVKSLQGITTGVTNKLDMVVFGVFIGLVIALIITGWFVGGIPIFAFIYSLIVIMGVIFSTVLANVWQTITAKAVFGATLSSFPISNHILNYLPLYTAVIGFIGLVVMFAKPAFSPGE